MKIRFSLILNVYYIINNDAKYKYTHNSISLGCKKDILILWDCSNSIKFDALKTKIIPFLKGLVNSKKLNVNKEGTHLGFITFSTKTKTKVLKKVGEIQDPDKLINWLNQYTERDFFNSNYKKEQMGAQTYTGEAFIRANEVSKPSMHIIPVKTYYKYWISTTDCH